MKSILIIGGAGFIGINSCRYFLEKGWKVTILDNFSRYGTDKNVELLQGERSTPVPVVRADVVSDSLLLAEEVEKHDVVIHLAAQVAVTTSIIDPRNDLNVNIIGTFNVLEAIRNSKRQPFLVYASTNKVYGGLEDLICDELPKRYQFRDEAASQYGVGEARPLDFHTPYGCSKGTGDQYVIDYSRIYGLKTVVFRQSCIYGPNQFGVEDQGWVAWFAIAAMVGKPINIYGNGKQVRDVLHVYDLVRLYDLAINQMEIANGQAYNVGGGPTNTLSLLELLDKLEKRLEKLPPLSYSEMRPGDQYIFIADIRKAKEQLGWEPSFNVDRGLDSMLEWLLGHRELFMNAARTLTGV